MRRKDFIDYALGNERADILFTNAKIVDVFTGKVESGSVAVAGSEIAGVIFDGDEGFYEAEQTIDLNGAYIMPGFVNAHVHVESSMITPFEYAKAELLWGTTTIITDPHEIVNVKGHDGLQYILNEARISPLNYMVMLPSCVPATSFENSGALMYSEDLTLYKGNPFVLGLGEMMDYPGLFNQDMEIMKKIEAFKDMVIDGHAPSVKGKQLNAYAGCGISTDHESVEFTEARDKLRRGMCVLVRNGSASQNLEAIIRGVVAEKIDTDRMAFATDDKHLLDICKEGTIRYNIIKAVELGLDEVEAVKMATINAARIYGLKKTGAIAPGYRADLVIADNISKLNVTRVYKNGRLIVDNGKYIGIDHDRALSRLGENKDLHKEITERLLNSVNPLPLKPMAFVLPVKDEYPVIEMVPHNIITRKGSISSSKLEEAIYRGEIAKIAVIERHNATGSHAVGLIRGYGLKRGAVATTVGHDSHNIIVVGNTDEDMFAAVDELKRIGGGYAIIRDGEVLDSLPLKIAGLMSTDGPDELIEHLDEMKKNAFKLGVNRDIDPFITLSFMALPVIPSIRITDMGMFDVDNFCFC